MKGVNVLLIILLVVLFGCDSIERGTRTENSYQKLSCENMVNPVGIEREHPSFSWVINSDGSNSFQSAYQIIVASSPDKLSLSDADCWNSGKILSDRSILVKYDGGKIQSAARYWWKVKVWNQDGEDIGWSEAQYFETGLMNERGWQGAKWIQMKHDDRLSEHRFRKVRTKNMPEPIEQTSFATTYFRHEIEALGDIKKATAYICGLGYYELLINGEKIGDHVLDPAPTSYDKRSLYVTYDITSELQNKKNTLGVILGNGFYGQNMAFGIKNLAYGKPAVRLLIRIENKNGEITYIRSDEQWKVSTGPIVFDNVYGGETYDARYELGDWAKNNYNEKSWKKVAIVNPKVERLEPQLMPPMRKIKEIKPKGIFKSSKGSWIIDFGQNITGWAKIYVNVENGKKIKLTYAEALTRKGDELHTGSVGAFATGFEQVSEYIGNGNGWQSWEPRFCYHGFQYVEIEGLTTKPALSNIAGILVHTDVDRKGDFSCSDETINRIYQLSEWTIVDNLHGIPEDCPHREKCGWLGDAHATAEFCLYNYDMNRFYHKYQKDIQSQLRLVNKYKNKPVALINKAKLNDSYQQKGNENKLYAVPPMIAPGKRMAGTAFLDWGVAEIYVPWYLYLHTGDMGLVKDHFDEMKQLVAYYLTFKNAKGYIANGLGDWCPPRWDRQKNPDAMECHPHVSANAYFFDVLGIMNKMALTFGDKKYADEMYFEQQDIKKAFNQNFLQKINNDQLWYGSQTATIMALKFGMVPDSIFQKVVDGLVYDIVEEKETHHSCGIHGNRYLYTVLSDLGMPELSYQLLTSPTFPGQAYIVNCGLTTWPERQWEWDSGIEWDRSLNHPMHAGFTAYLYESLAGIRPIKDYPGYKKFVIAPSFVESLDWMKAKVESPYGVIKSEWKREGEVVKLNISVPFNSLANVELPNGIKEIKVNGKVELNRKTEFELNAGKYEFEIIE